MTNSNLPAGSTIGGKYQVVRLIGEGGMGAVYEARNEITLKRVAIKLMHAALASDGQAAARMMREAQTSSRVRHPNVVDVYDAGREGDSVFLVMEYLEGESFGQAVRRGGMLLHDALALLVDAMRGVAAAHRVGVIHRDIKPENIFLAREGDQPRPVPKVLDFGVSKLADDSSLRLTGTDVTIGTPLYMSYEQLSGLRDGVDARADVYAFGVILYELLTGRPPHLAQTLAQLGMLIATVEPPSPRQLRPELPAALDAIVRRATAKYPDERTKSVELLIQELAPFTRADGFAQPLEVAEAVHLTALPHTQPSSQDGHTVELPETGERLSAPAAPTAPSLPSQRSATKRVAVAGALLGGLIGLVTLLLLLRPPEPPPAPPSLPAAAHRQERDVPRDELPPLTPSTQVTSATPTPEAARATADLPSSSDTADASADAATLAVPRARQKPQRLMGHRHTSDAAALPVEPALPRPQRDSLQLAVDPPKAERIYRAGKPKRSDF